MYRIHCFLGDGKQVVVYQPQFPILSDIPYGCITFNVEFVGVVQ